MLGKIVATINVETWQAFGVLFAIVGGQVFKFFQEFIRDRRERDMEQQRLDVLKQMLGNLIHLNETQAITNQKLESVVEVDRIHHEELLRALDGRPPIKTNQPKPA